MKIIRPVKGRPKMAYYEFNYNGKIIPDPNEEKDLILPMGLGPGVIHLKSGPILVLRKNCYHSFA